MALDVQRITGTSAKVAARLCNFETAQSYLLNAHIEFLDDEVAKVIRGMKGPWVDLFGYASRRGDPVFNDGLSQRRMETVKKRISFYANSVNFQQQIAHGESKSGTIESDNDGYWRAVEVYVYATRPPPPTPTPPVVAGSTEFQIRVVGGASWTPFGIMLQGDGYVFQIVDTKNRKTAFYIYQGMGVALPGLPKIPGSMTKNGPPFPFKTTLPVTLPAFHGRASLYQDPGASAGDLSVGGTLRLTPKSEKLLPAGVRPSILPISGGWGIQPPSTGSATEGSLSMQGGVFDFTAW